MRDIHGEQFDGARNFLNSATYGLPSRRVSEALHGALRAWVVRILVNNCYDILRSQKRETSLPPDQAEIMRWDASPDADLMMRDLLLGLADEYRLPLMLFYAEGYRIREIAEILHLPQGTVQSRLHRAKKLLRQSMALEKEMSER